MKDLRHTRTLGLITGVSMAFTGAIGMIEKFDERTLTNPFLTMGMLIFLGIPVGIGVMAAKGRPNPLEEPTRDPRQGAFTVLVMGLIAGTVASAFVLVVDTFAMTRFFPNMRPSMVEVMTFGFGVPIGLVVLTAAVGLAGTAGGFFFGMAAKPRRGLGIALGWVLGFSLLEVVVSDIL